MAALDLPIFVPTLVAALGCGLIAGVFYAFSTFIMKALARLPPAGGIAAMQSINVAVLNPWFLGVFLGTALVCGGVIVMAVLRWNDAGAACLLAGGALYLLGTFGVTMVFNVPRNNALAAVDPQSADGAAVWTRYLAEWVWWNHVRTAAAFAAMIAFILALAV